MAGQVSADACSLCPPDSQPHSRAAHALTGNKLPSSRQGRTGLFLRAEYNGSKSTRAVGLSAIAHSVDGTLLTTVCSTWSSALSQPHTQNLDLRRSGLQLGLEQPSCQVRSRAGSGRDLAEIYTLSQTGGFFCCGASHPSCHHLPGGRQRLEPRGLC